MLSPYRIHPNNNNKRVKKHTNTNFDNNSNIKKDLKKAQMTSNDLKNLNPPQNPLLKLNPLKVKTN